LKDNNLEKIIIETVDIPSLPFVAMKVLKFMNDDNSSISALENIVLADQSFSTRLLRIANSPYYGRGRTIDTVSTAIILIGFNTMKNLVVAASMKDLHRNFGFIEQKLWEHSLGVSIAASLIAFETKLVQSEEALVAGLIHDVGKTVLNNSMPDTYALITERVSKENIRFVDIENDMLKFNHCGVGGLIARKWKLPKNLEVVIEYHHTDKLPASVDSSYETICKLLRVADEMCLIAGIGLSRHIEVADIGFKQIGLSEKKFVEILDKLKKTYNEQRDELLQ